MDTENSITLQVLIDMRDELRKTNARLDEINVRMDGRLDQLGRKIDQTNKQLLNTETRLATEISALRAVVTDGQDNRVDERLSRCERERAAQK